MTSTTTVSTIVNESDTIRSSTELNEKKEFNKRFKPTNQKQNNQSKNQKQHQPGSVNVQPLRADHIKEHRLWALASSIVCFFMIAPFICLYHSRRIREMKTKQELTRAQSLSTRVNNMLMISNIMGLIVWVAIIFVIAVLFIMGALVR
ncbi:unnamed protein product [Rotaria sp. Silwood2]|nr:unnamed protein product [Rotaria sp. Silwood2]CAF2572780.1 unnamed protein product [Rotaria sp. Silwood2]CAF2816846.1 unnamed protein product [Rotaria sp. Silwood2]CAF2965719.1 unnamed protein product [Rotaria sp. Silwood2]CAF3888004.1 unnamed protein product [Rotaria sp. Silwood2]